MQLPEKRIRPAGNRTDSDDQQGSGSDNNPTADREAKVADAEAGFVGVLLVVGRRKAAELVAAVPTEAIKHPAHRWVCAAVRAALDDGAEPDPVTVAAAADRAGFVAPRPFGGRLALRCPGCIRRRRQPQTPTTTRTW